MVEHSRERAYGISWSGMAHHLPFNQFKVAFALTVEGITVDTVEGKLSS